MPNARHTPGLRQGVLSYNQRLWLLRVGAILLGILCPITIASTPNYMRYVAVPILIFGVLFVLLLLSTDTATSPSLSPAQPVKGSCVVLESPQSTTLFQIHHDYIGDITKYVIKQEGWVNPETLERCYRLTVAVPQQEFLK